MLYQHFGIDSYTFGESVEKLERLEILESSSDLTIIKIGEQVLGTYFFYKTFFKDQLLDFSVVLSHYFDTHLDRIADTVVPANNTFGYENVYNKIDPYLVEYWRIVKHDEIKAFRFLEVFWLYKVDEALGFVYERIQTLPEVENPLYKFTEEKDYKSPSENDKYISLLSKFFYYSLDCLTSFKRNRTSSM